MKPRWEESVEMIELMNKARVLEDELYKLFKELLKLKQLIWIPRKSERI